MRDIILLKDGWRFGITAAVEGESMPVLPETMETVSIPHVWNKDDPAKTGYCVYQYSFRGEDISGEKVFVEFGAVGEICKVWLNGQYIGTHRGGYSCFRFELTDALCKGENILTVFADNKSMKTATPSAAISTDTAAYTGM